MVKIRAGLGLCCNSRWNLSGWRVDCTYYGGELGNLWGKRGRCRLHWVGLMGVVGGVGGCGWSVWALVGGMGVTNGRSKGVMGREWVWSPVCMERYMAGCGRNFVWKARWVRSTWVWLTGCNGWGGLEYWLLTPLGGSKWENNSILGILSCFHLIN